MYWCSCCVGIFPKEACDPFCNVEHAGHDSVSILPLADNKKIKKNVKLNRIKIKASCWNCIRKPKPWLVLFSPQVIHQYGLMLIEPLCNCGSIEICSDDCVIHVYLSFFPPTEQLSYLGGLYHQGRQTAVAAQVRPCVCAHKYNPFVSVCKRKHKLLRFY